MEKRYLSLTVLFLAQNLNYGEGFGNILTLKKISSKGKSFSYISRQALRYDIVRILEDLNYELTPVGKTKGVVQFNDDANIDKYAEIDFFGYMKTTKGESGSIRKAIVRLSDAISIEPFAGEIDFSTNKGLADRIKQNNDIYQSEIHRSFYSYTLTLELDKVGIDDKIKLSNEEKIKRVISLLKAIKLLNRDIKGKKENLNPLFIIGGIYDFGNPFFYNILNLEFTKDKVLLNTNTINDILKTTTITDDSIAKDTKIGFTEGIFSNIDKINVSDKLCIEDFFKNLNEKITQYYKEQ